MALLTAMWIWCNVSCDVQASHVWFSCILFWFPLWQSRSSTQKSKFRSLCKQSTKLYCASPGSQSELQKQSRAKRVQHSIEHICWSFQVYEDERLFGTLEQVSKMMSCQLGSCISCAYQLIPAGTSGHKFEPSCNDLTYWKSAAEEIRQQQPTTTGAWSKKLRCFAISCTFKGRSLESHNAAPWPYHFFFFALPLCFALSLDASTIAQKEIKQQQHTSSEWA